MSAVTVGQAALILFREGAEALLVMAALAAYLARSGAADKTRVLYWGAGLAIAASLAVAFAFQAFMGGGNKEIVEGATLLIAAAVLIYVSGWLFARRDAAQWQAYLRARVDTAVATASGIAPLGLIAFLAVFREGAETALFLQALAGGAPDQQVAVLTGVAVGALGLAVLFYLVRSLAVRLPLKPFFTATAALLYVLAITFVAKGMGEFQELGWLPLTAASLPEWLEGLGVGASWQAIGAQAVLVALVPVGMRLPMMRAPRTADAAAG